MKLKVQNKVTLLLLLAALLPLLVLSQIFIQIVKDAFVERSQQGLAIMLDSETARVRQIIQQLHDKFYLISSRTQLRSYVSDLNSKDDPEKSSAVRRILLDAAGSLKQITNISIYNRSKKLLISSNLSRVDDTPMTCASCSKSPEIIFSDIWREGELLILEFVGPLFAQGKVVGWMSILFQNTLVSKPYVLNNPQLASRETILLKMEPEWLALSDYAHTTDRSILPVRNFHTYSNCVKAHPENYATICNNVLKPLDYRGKEIIGALNYIPEYKLALFSKLDLQEVEAAILPIKKYLLYWEVVTAVLVTGIGWFVALYFVSPLKKLIRAAQEISKGNFSQELTVRTGDELEQLAETINQMADALHNLVVLFSHTLKTPLHGSSLTAELLLEDPANIAKGEDEIATIKKCSDSAIAIIDDFMLYLHATTMYEKNLLMKSERLKEHIESKLPVLKPTIEWHFETPEVSVPPIHFVHLLRCLLTHASIRSGPEDTVEIFIKTEKENLVIDIENKSRALSDLELSKIFVPFFRLSENTTEDTGLTMCISRKLIQHIKGTITVESSPEAGTRYTVTLPSIAIGHATYFANSDAA